VLDSAIAVSQRRACKLYAPDLSHAVHKRFLEHQDTADTLTALRDRLASGMTVRYRARYIQSPGQGKKARRT
jgi:hypothetical protein